LSLPNTAILDSCPPGERAALEDDFRAIAQASGRGLSASRANSSNTSWLIWESFCHALAQDPTLVDLADPIPLLRLFAHRYRSGALAPSGARVRSRTVEGAVRAVGQTVATLGSPDPRLQPSGKLDLRLQRLLKAYAKEDDPPTRVKPIPLPVIAHAVTICHLQQSSRSLVIADMLILGFFFLLRPGEYATTSNPDSTPFRLQDVRLYRNQLRLDYMTAPLQHLHTATAVALEFTNQKNGVRGELVGLRRSGHPTLCPVVAVVNRLIHLRLHRAPPTTFLYQHYDGVKWAAIDASALTATLRQAAHATGGPYGIVPADISARSLRSSGAMALLCAAVDTDVIRLLGRWRSDEMMRYLHVQALPILAPLATQMVTHGAFALLPNPPIPPLP
jgi:hypothetical protein